MGFPKTLFGSIILAACVVGCAGVQSPILYPNAQLQQVGKAQADTDVEQCRALASQYVPETLGTDLAQHTGIGAIAGAALGALAGAVSGGGAGSGAAIGAATGGTAGALGGLVKQADPSPAFKGFVDRCLSERGYEVAGWQ